MVTISHKYGTWTFFVSTLIHIVQYKCHKRSCCWTYTKSKKNYTKNCNKIIGSVKKVSRVCIKKSLLGVYLFGSGTWWSVRRTVRHNLVMKGFLIAWRYALYWWCEAEALTRWKMCHVFLVDFTHSPLS